MLTVTELNEFASSARDSLFRLETLDRYEVPIDGSDLSVYLAGGEQPHNAAKLAWQEHLRAERAAGIWRHRVHLIDTTHGLGGYLRYECEWDTPRPPPQERASASLICPPPAALVS
ncbi:MAG: DUF6879 family protein [Pseudonocardiaceae bacterium]